MSYTDKEMQLATQVAYVNITEKTLSDYRRDYGKEPTLQDLFVADNYGPLFDNFMSGHKPDATGVDVDRKEAAQAFWDEIVSGDSACSDWKVVEVEDDNINSGFYGCAIETSNNEAIIGFRGSENPEDIDNVMKDWLAADAGLLNNPTGTVQQYVARDFVESFVKKDTNSKYTSITLTGHSLGGNLAESVVITCDEETLNKIVKCVSLDGPGFSAQYINYFQENIRERANLITHYQWSLVGGFFFNVPGANNQLISVTDQYDNIGDINSLMLKHDTCFIYFDKSGNIQTTPYPDTLSALTGALTRMIDGVASGFCRSLVDLQKWLYETGSTAEGRAAINKFVSTVLVVKLMSDPKNMTAIMSQLVLMGSEWIANEVLPYYWDIISSGIDSNVMARPLAIGNPIGAMAKLASWFQNAIVARRQADPLLIDMGKDGFDLHGTVDGVHFDLDSNGMAEKMGWSSKDGILTLDLNGNGTIDNGREIFGDQMMLVGGTLAKGGFEALAQYDTDKNGIIDADDEIFRKLLVWVDTDKDGVSGEKELKTLSELGITSIHINQTTSSGQTGSIGSKATVIFNDGSTAEIGEFWAGSNLYDTVEHNRPVISDDILKLPDIRSMGNVRSLHSAIAADTSGELKGLVESFLKCDSQEDRYDLIEQIMIHVAGAKDIATNSRGSEFDGQKLAVLEAFMGQVFEGQIGANPNPEAAVILTNMYNSLKDMYYSELMSQGALKKYVNLIKTEKDQSGERKYDLAVLNAYLYCELIAGQVDESVLKDISKYVSYQDRNHSTSYEMYYQLRSFFGEMDEKYVNAIEEGASSPYLGKAGNDALTGGAENDLILGRAGNDYLNGNGGNDTLDGGAGNDTLSGGAGDDTYIFGRGYGTDSINDSQGKSKIKFLEGIAPEDLVVNARNTYDILLTIRGTNDSIILTNFRNSPAYQNFELEFADGTIMSLSDADSPFMNVAGTDGDDRISGSLK